MSKGLVLLGGLLGVGYLMTRGGTASASQAPRPSVPGSAPTGSADVNWNGFAAQAAATRDPRVMRYAAEQLQRVGMNDQAQALLLAAAAIEAANASAAAANAAPPATSGQTSVTTPVVYQTPGVVAQAQSAAAPMLATLPPVVAQQVTDALGAAAATAQQAQQTATGASAASVPPVHATEVTADPKRSAAESLANHLRGTVRYREDRTRVKAFQTMVGQLADGKYGVGTAIAIGDLGVIPAKPYYYSPSATKTRTMKNQWTAYCNEKATTDPTRAAQWTAIANVERD